MNSSLLKHSENIPDTVMCHLPTIKKEGSNLPSSLFKVEQKWGWIRLSFCSIIYKTFIQESTKGGILSKYKTLCDGSAAGTSSNSLSTKAVILDAKK